MDFTDSGTFRVFAIGHTTLLIHCFGAEASVPGSPPDRSVSEGKCYILWSLSESLTEDSLLEVLSYTA